MANNTSLAETSAPDSRSLTLSETCPTKLLSDEPASSDAFGPHRRIARAIADLIVPKGAVGLSIGLEGSWGSGKSTVARILTDLIGQENDTLLVPFDVWAHEGDPLRRTFLENLIRHLQHEGWIEKKKWDRKIEELANRWEKVTTKDTLELSREGKLVGITLFLVPIGSALVTAALREDITFINTGSIAVKFLLLAIPGVLLSFAPLIAVLSTLKKSSDVIGLLFNKGLSEKTTETSKTINPTSIEFEDTFNEILNEALGNNSRKLLLIIDNLDRIESAEALSMWSTLQTFLRHKMDPPPWQKHLWILILYDLKGLSQIWKRSAENRKNTTAFSFIEKRFQVRFEVPPPVLSNWRDFLIEKLQEAFPKHEEADLHEVYRVLEISLTKDGRRPTIRELKLFVNQIGSIHRQWAGANPEQDVFKLSHIACHVLLGRYRDDVVKDLLSDGFVYPEYQTLLGIEIRDTLLALALNVEVKLAQQLVFSGKIQEALAQGNSDGLNKLANALPSGFWEILEKVLVGAWSDAVKIPDAAYALEGSQLLQKAPAPMVSSVTKGILEIARGVDSWFPLTEQTAQGIAVILKWKSNLNQKLPDDFLFRIFSGVALGFRDEAIHAQSGFNVTAWLKMLDHPLRDLQPDQKVKAFETLVDKLGESIQKKDALDSSELQAVVELLSELHSYPDASVLARTRLKTLVDEGHVGRQLQLNSEKSPAAIAWSVFIICEYASKFQSSSIAVENPPTGHAKLSALLADPSGAMVETFVTILERYNRLPILFEALSDQPELKSFQLLSLRRALKSSDVLELLGDPTSMQRLRSLFREMGSSEQESSDLGALVIKLMSTPQLREQLVNEEFDSTDSRLYTAVVKAAPDSEFADLKPWFEKGMAAAQVDDWHDQLANTGSMVSLAFELRQKNIIESLGEHYFDALVRLARDLINGLIAAPAFKDNLASLMGEPRSALRIAFRKNLWGLLTTDGSRGNERFYEVFGPELSEQVLIPSEEFPAHNVFQVIIKEKPAAGLEWMKNLFTASANRLADTYRGSEGFNQFKKSLQQELQGNESEPQMPPDAALALMAIGESMSIKPIANGLLAVTASPDGFAEIHFLRMDQDAHIEVLNPERFLKGSEPAWSADGAKLAFARKESGGLNKVWSIDADGSNETCLTSHPKISEAPTWAPDGRRIAFIRREGSTHAIYTIDLKGMVEKQISPNHLHCEQPSWSPDGKTLAFCAERDDFFNIFAISPDGSNFRVVTEVPHAHDPNWSPDGRKIVFVRHLPDGGGGLHMIDCDGQNDVMLVSDDKARYYAPVWSPDGKTIAYQVGSGSEGNLYLIDVQSKERRQLITGFAEPSWQALNRIVN